MKGLCVIAGDISPIGVISHLPVFCEENSVPCVLGIRVLGMTGHRFLGVWCLFVSGGRSAALFVCVFRHGPVLKSPFNPPSCSVLSSSP